MSAVLAALIHRKRLCLEQLLTLAHKQRVLIDGDQITALLDLLAVKQRLLYQLREVDTALKPFSGQAPEERRWGDDQQRRLCAAEVAECQRLLAQIVGQEKEDSQRLVERRDAVEQALQGMHVASQARAAYVTPGPAAVTQIDLSTEAGGRR